MRGLRRFLVVDLHIFPSCCSGHATAGAEWHHNTAPCPLRGSNLALDPAGYEHLVNSGSRHASHPKQMVDQQLDGTVPTIVLRALTVVTAAGDDDKIAKMLCRVNL